MNSKYLILGIDAGGSKTSACLAAFHPGRSSLELAIEVLAVGEAGAGNCRAVGLDIAMGNVQSAMVQALSQAGESGSAVDSLCIGMAGAGRHEEQAQVAAWVSQHLQTKRCTVVGDAPLVLAAACGSWPVERLRELEGVALISGTGSMAWGRDRGGDEQRCGGWGYLLGDEGSGYWLASRGLRAACRAADGRSLPTDLLPAFMERFGLNHPAELIGKVYAGAFDRRQMARLAPLVIQSAEADSVAAQIVMQAAEELSAMVAVIVDKLGLRGSDYLLALGGGLLVNSPLLSRWTIDCLERGGIKPAATGVVPKPVIGAVYLAASLIEC